MKKILLGLLLLGAVACTAPAGLDEPVSVQKIWGEAPHSAFTGLVDHQGKFYCCFREANSHVPKTTGVPGDNGIIRIISSPDGTVWSDEGAIQLEGVDLRDPGISKRPDGSLMIIMGGSRYQDGTFLSGDSYVSFRDPESGKFSAPEMIAFDKEQFPGKVWMWRVRWNSDAGYGVAYEDDRVSLLKTRDGLHYWMIARFDVDSLPNETDLLFGPGDDLTLIMRREFQNAHGLVGRSKHPYDSWTWQDCGIKLGGPGIVRLPNREVLVGSRDHDTPGEAHVGLYDLGADGKLAKLCRLPSGGDCSYPGFVVRGDTLFMSYYSSHEDEKSQIYLAAFKLPKE